MLNLRTSFAFSEVINTSLKSLSCVAPPPPIPVSPWIPCGPCGPTPPDAAAVIDDEDETAAATVVAEIMLATLVALTETETADPLIDAAITFGTAATDATVDAVAVAVIGVLITVAEILTHGSP